MSIIQSLRGGDQRTLGRANAVTRRVRRDPQLLAELFRAMFDGDPVIRMRASDCVEKIVRARRELSLPFKKLILKNLAHFDEQPEMKMHLALLLGYLELSRGEAVKVSEVLFHWLRNEVNKFIQVNCLTGLCEISLRHPWLRQEVMATIVEFMIKGSAALKARGRILLKKLSKADEVE